MKALFFVLGIPLLGGLVLALVGHRDRARDLNVAFSLGTLLAAAVVALLPGVAPAAVATLALVVAAMVAVLASGLILFETSRIVNGGETNYVMATVGLYVSIYNLFTSLLALLGMGGNSE